MVGLGRVNFYPSPQAPPIIPGTGGYERLVKDLEASLGPRSSTRIDHHVRYPA